jgi:hypothetical protein
MKTSTDEDSFLWKVIAPGFVNCEKGCTRLAAASDKAYQLLAHGLFFSPGSPASHTTKTGPKTPEINRESK